MSVRRPDFAGSWYPDTASGCKAMFDQFERESVAREGTEPVTAGIVPHAGWMFSGRIAYNVIRELARDSGQRDTVVLFGGHLAPSSPMTIMARGELWTPLGTIPADEELAAAILDEWEVVRETPERHAPDNTTELQAPIIRHFFPEAMMVVIGAPPREATLRLADSLVGHATRLGRRLAVIGSTDLTHYGPNYGWAPMGLGDEAVRWVREENDPRWIERARQLDAQGMIKEAMDHKNACCPGAAAAAAQCARALGSSSGELLAYATSADIRPDASFVGYAGIVYY